MTAKAKKRVFITALILTVIIIASVPVLVFTLKPADDIFSANSISVNCLITGNKITLPIKVKNAVKGSHGLYFDNDGSVSDIKNLIDNYQNGKNIIRAEIYGTDSILITQLVNDAPAAFAVITEMKGKGTKRWFFSDMSFRLDVETVLLIPFHFMEKKRDEAFDSGEKLVVSASTDDIYMFYQNAGIYNIEKNERRIIINGYKNDEYAESSFPIILTLSTENEVNYLTLTCG